MLPRVKLQSGSKGGLENDCLNGQAVLLLSDGYIEEPGISVQNRKLTAAQSKPERLSKRVQAKKTAAVIIPNVPEDVSYCSTVA